MSKTMTRSEATAFFAAFFRGETHIPSKVKDHGSEWTGGIFSVSVATPGFATFDFDELTRLVFLAHERSVRAWILPTRHRKLRICIQARDREGNEMNAVHPTIKAALAKFRTMDDLPWWKVLQHHPDVQAREAEARAG